MTWMRWVILWAALAKAADAGLDKDAPTLAVVWLAVAALVAVNERAGCAMAALVAMGSVAAELPGASNHVVAVGWVAACLALFPPGPHRRAALQSTAVVIYLFAGLNKVLFGFLDGTIINGWLPFDLPQLVAVGLSVGGAFGEVWLAVAVWRRWRSALPVALLLHAGIVVWSAAPLVRAADLNITLLFNGLLVALVVAVTRSADGVSGCREVRRDTCRRQGGRVEGGVLVDAGRASLGPDVP